MHKVAGCGALDGLPDASARRVIISRPRYRLTILVFPTEQVCNQSLPGTPTAEE